MKNLTCALWVFSLMFLLTFGVPVTGNAAGQIAAWGRNTYGQTISPSTAKVVKAVAAGDAHSVALLSDGTVAAWGGNDMGQTNVPVGLRNVVAIAAKRNFNLALRADGTVAAWGQNSAEQANVPTNLTDVVAIATGGNHVLALRSGGSVAAWGYNDGGQSSVPAGLSNVISVAAGAAHSLVLKADGTVAGWGRDSHNLTNFPQNLSNIVAIAAGHEHSLALRDDGTVVGWGSNTHGQVNVPSGLSNVVKIVAGSFHSLALRADGTLTAWGLVYHDVPALPSGLCNVTDMAGGNSHSLAIVFGGPIQVTQEPQSKTISLSSKVTFSVIATGAQPISYQWLRNGTVLKNNSRYSGIAEATFTISDARFDDAGTYSVVMSNALGSVASRSAVLTVVAPPSIMDRSPDRTVRAGTNINLFVSAAGTTPLFYQWSRNGILLSDRTSSSFNLSNVQPIDSGNYSVVVTNAYGAARADMQLTVTNSAPYILKQPFVRLNGQITTTNPVATVGSSVVFELDAKGSTPLSYQWRFDGADIPNATNATLELRNLQHQQVGYYSVVVSNAFGETSSAKIYLNVVQVFVWGDGFTGNTNTPVGLTNVVAVSAGNSHVAALRSDGTVKSWLANVGHIFGSKSVTNTPPGATNISAIQSGPDHIVALRSNGTVVAWGESGSGQTNVPLNLLNVVAVAAGPNRSFAIRSDGSVVGWGTQGLVPPSLSNVVAITTASPQNAQNFALLRDGSVFGWPSIETALSVSNAIAVDGGSAGFLALKKDGTLWNSTGRVRLPQNLSNLVAVAANNFAGMVLKADGSLVASESFGKVPSPLLSNVTAIAVGGVQTDFGVALIGSGVPAITLQPLSQFAQSGAAIQLHARAAGVQPMSFQWQVDNRNIPGATNSSLIFPNLQGKHTGNYRMLASNALGSTFSATARLTTPFSTNLPAALNATNLVWSAGLTNISPTNTTWFAQIQETHNGDVAAQSGAISHNQQIPLSTSVYGPGTLTFWWKVSSEGGYDFLRWSMDSTIPLASISGETEWAKMTVSIPAGTHVLRWTYVKDGSVSSGRDAGWVDDVVFTRPVPKIIRHPFDQTVSVGSNVTMPAVAESSTPMTYQWLKNGTNILGATAQYLTLTNVTASDAGFYAIKVSNLYGSVTSSNAILTVLVLPQLNSFQVLPDGNTRFLLGDGVGGASIAENRDAFEVQASTNVKDWITLPITPTLTNGSLMFHDTNSKNFPMRFYRIVAH